MLLNDYQISMRPLCSDRLFKPVDYIFVTCLTKFLSWLVGVQSIPCSNNYICILIMLLSFSSKSVIKFWAMNWALGLKKWHKSWSHMRRSEEKIPHTHAYPCHGSVWYFLDACLSISMEHMGV